METKVNLMDVSLSYDRKEDAWELTDAVTFEANRPYQQGHRPESGRNHNKEEKTEWKSDDELPY